ncbi:MAG: type II toxin-antitoxin system ParD family antitoxin, partial [Steroidobacter sp.]
LRLIETKEAEDKARLKSLREAARIGAADIDAGRFRHFASPTELRRHLKPVIDKAIGSKNNRTR